MGARAWTAVILLTVSTSSSAGSNEINDELVERVAKLEDLSKLTTLRSCSEYAKFGLKRSGMYMIDPDGPLIGQEPFQVVCNFATGATEVMHNLEDKQPIKRCHKPGCYEKDVKYINGANSEPVEKSQLEALIELSNVCEEDFHYNCKSAPLKVGDVDYAFWEDRHGGKNMYFTGSNYGVHSCDCHFTDDCHNGDDQGHKCNCDSNEPLELTDTGTITNMTALPIMKIFFGGLQYESETASYRLGRLKCYGERKLEVATSCSMLKKQGVTLSGYYNIKEDGNSHTRIVFCDMSGGTYSDVPQLDQVSDSSPLGTILAWVPSPNDDNKEEIPNGWVPCDGRQIPSPSVWAGAKTPDLNKEGRFLRGGSEEEARQTQSDAMQDHQHEDNGHRHSASSSSSAGRHRHGYSDRSTFYNSRKLLFHYDYGGSKAGYGYIDRDTDYASITISTTTSVDKATSGIGNIKSTYRKSDETRPKNMRVVWIMRCW